MTECNQSRFGFEACGKREIVARFDGGTISSDGGALLLGQTDKRLNLLPRLAECFLDGRKIRSGWSIRFGRCSHKASTAWLAAHRTDTRKSPFGKRRWMNCW